MGPKSNIWSLLGLLFIVGSLVIVLILLPLAEKPKSDKRRSGCYVTTKSGRIAGKELKFKGTHVCQFLGIPYGMPPTGHRRFAKSQPITKWTGLYEAFDWGPNCHQAFPSWARHMMTPTTQNMSEDCLFINIWSPSVSKTRLRPVLFWIHGGGYQFGSGSLDETNATLLASFTDLVVVTINYRLNAFGFLNLQTEEVPGNMGLYDQALALQWVSDNINYIGGDPEQITLWGQGMGAISVSAHFVSPFTKNLFKRAILQTGSIFVTSAMSTKFEEVADELISLVGCNASAPLGTVPQVDRQIVACLRSISTEGIQLAANRINERNPISFLFSPYEAFFNGSSPEEVREGLLEYASERVTDILFGFNEDEGSLLIHSMLPLEFPGNATPQINDLEEGRDILSRLFEDKMGVNKAVIRTGLNSALPEGLNSSRSIVKAMYDFIAHNVFVCPLISFADKISDSGLNVSLYMYHYTQRSQYNKLPSWFRVIHNEEVPMQFGYPLRYPRLFTNHEATFSERLMETWSGFAKTGSPLAQLGKKWPKYSIKEPNFMEINAFRSKIGRGLHKKSCDIFKLALDFV